MIIFFETINNLILAFIGVTVAIFIFAVTLLGDAIKKSEEEKKRHKEEEIKKFDTEIRKITEGIKTAEKSRDISKVSDQIAGLEKNKKDTNRAIRSIEERYSLISLKNSIIYPTTFFVLAILFNNLSQILINYERVLYLIGVLLIIPGLERLYRVLLLIQEVSLSSEEFEIKKLSRAFASALKAHAEEQEEELYIIIDKQINCKTGEEVEVEFKIGISKGKIVRNAFTMFYLPDGIETVDPKTGSKQPKEKVPEIAGKLTIKKLLGDINKGLMKNESVKLKMPDHPGDFTLFYELHGDGYADSRKDFKIYVS